MDSAQLAITHLLIVAEDNQAANRLLSHLRQDRLALRAANVLSEKEFAQLVTQDQWDVLVCFDNGRLSLDTVLGLRKKHEQDFPVLLVTTQTTTLDLLSLYRQGVNDVVAQDQLPYLSLSVQRAAEQYWLTRQNRKQAVLHRELEKRHEALLNASITPVAYIQEGIHLYCNNEYAQSLGYDSSATIQVKPFLNLFVLGERDRIKALLRQEISTETIASVQFLRADGSELAAQLRLIPVDYQGRSCLQVTFTAVADNSTSNLISLPNDPDQIAKSLNRADFLTKIEIAIRQAVQQGNFSTLFITKLNELADITAIIGNTNRNLLLKDITLLLQKLTGHAGLVGSIDEDCFAFLLAKSDPDELRFLADKITVQLHNLIRSYIPPALALDCTLGMALINGHALDAETILQRALQSIDGTATLSAGTSAGSGLNSDEAVTLGSNINNRLAYFKHALTEQRFLLNYQPLVPIKGGPNHGYAVLLRMLDEQDQPVTASEFLSLAIANGMGETIDRMVVSLLLNSEEARGNSDSLLLHLTSTTLANLRFLPWLHAQLQEAQFPVQRLVLYISEIDIHNDVKNAKEFIKKATKLNFTIAISHFGSAIEPFSIFQHIRPSFVTLDESVVRDLAFSQLQRSSVKVLTTALHKLSIKVATPQVEHVDVLPILWSIDTDFVQGYCLQAPTAMMNYAFTQEEEIMFSLPT